MAWDFTVDSEIQLDMANILKGKADELDQQFGNLYSQIGSLGQHWVGSDYDAFNTGCLGYKQALADLTDSVRMYATHFEKVAEGTDYLAADCIAIIQNMTTRGDALPGTGNGQGGNGTGGNGTGQGGNGQGGNGQGGNGQGGAYGAGGNGTGQGGNGQGGNGQGGNGTGGNGYGQGGAGGNGTGYGQGGNGYNGGVVANGGRNLVGQGTRGINGATIAGQNGNGQGGYGQGGNGYNGGGYGQGGYGQGGNGYNNGGGYGQGGNGTGGNGTGQGGAYGTGGTGTTGKNNGTNSTNSNGSAAWTIGGAAAGMMVGGVGGAIVGGLAGNALGKSSTGTKMGVGGAAAGYLLGGLPGAVTGYVAGKAINGYQTGELKTAFAKNDYYSTVKEDFTTNFDYSNCDNLVEGAIETASGITKTAWDGVQLTTNIVKDATNTGIDAVQYALFDRDENYYENLGEDFSENFDYSNCDNVVEGAITTVAGVARTAWDAGEVVINATTDLAQEAVDFLIFWD